MIKTILILLSLICCIDLHSKDIILDGRKDVAKQMIVENANYIVRSSINLKGKTISIPSNSTLTIKGGLLSNGTLIGSNTKLIYEGSVFNKVKICGSWNVPILRSSMFQNIAEQDVLKELIALSSPNVSNKIYVEKGTYLVSAPTAIKGALDLKSNTNLSIDGTISLVPNNFTGCSVIRVKNSANVTITGKGIIEGDKLKHTGATGEWGMGIQIMASKNVIVEGLTVCNCWGDCIYIGDNSSNVTISACNLHYARRQGISVTYATNCKIDRCVIHDIAGTAPEYGIDFEPNANCSVHHMYVSNTEIYNCKGGMIAGIKGGNAPNASVGDVVIEGCYVHSLRTKNYFRWHNCKNITIKNCRIDKPKRECTFMVDATNIRYTNIKELWRKR